MAKRKPAKAKRATKTRAKKPSRKPKAKAKTRAQVLADWSKRMGKAGVTKVATISGGKSLRWIEWFGV